MATKTQQNLVTVDWMVKNRQRVNWKHVAREAKVPYSRIANVFRHEKPLGNVDTKKISRVLIRICGDECEFYKPDDN